MARLTLAEIQIIRDRGHAITTRGLDELHALCDTAQLGALDHVEHVDAALAVNMCIEQMKVYLRDLPLRRAPDPYTPVKIWLTALELALRALRPEVMSSPSDTTAAKGT